MNWFLVSIAVLVGLVLITFLVYRNLKDEKSFEKQINEDYKKTKDGEDDIEVE